MAAGHLARQMEYYRDYEAPHHPNRLKIEAAARKANERLDCSRVKAPATRMDCCVVPCST